MKSQMYLSRFNLLRNLVLILFFTVYARTLLQAQTSRLTNGEYRTDLNGVTHWYRIAGAEHRTTPLVIVHGGPGGNVYNFERVPGRYLERFFTVIYYEQRGSGRSSPPSSPDAYSMSLLISDLELLRRKLTVPRMILLGFSFGGEIALEYSLAYPNRVEKLILQSPSVGEWQRMQQVHINGFLAVSTGDLAHKIRGIAQGNEPLEERWNKIWSLVDSSTVDRLLFHDTKTAQLNRKLWEENKLINSGQMYQALKKQPQNSPSLLERARQAGVPTLVLVGLYDRNVGLDNVRDLASSIPRAKLVIFEQSAHFPDMEETATYITLVRTFVTSRRQRPNNSLTPSRRGSVAKTILR